MEIKNITIESGEAGTDNVKVVIAGIEIKNPVPITLNFDSRRIIGKAEVFIKDGVLKANMNLNKDIDLDCFPAIGFSSISSTQNGEILEVQESKLYSVGICKKANCDESIKSIGDQIVKS